MKTELVGWVWLISCVGLLVVFLLSNDLKYLETAAVLGLLGVILIRTPEDKEGK
jgi:hypothetical protein